MPQTGNGDLAQVEYQGALTLPGEDGPRNASILLDRDQAEVSIRFDPPIPGASEWKGRSVTAVQRPKYLEVVFNTTDLPRETLVLTWKFNASRHDNTLAGVIVVRPNDLRISGEKGFTMVRPA